MTKSLLVYIPIGRHIGCIADRNGATMTLTTPAKKDCLRESGAFAWVVVIALGLMSAGTTGTYSIIAGSFVAPVCEDLGFDYTSFSFYFTAILLGLALGLPLLSRFIPKVIGKPWHICIELVLIVAGAAMAFYTEVWMFTVSAAVIGICFSFTTGVCMSDVIDQWFSNRPVLPSASLGALILSVRCY